MKPASFEYHSPSTVEEALSLLDEYDRIQPVAGNQSLSLEMSTRSVEPNHLVDISSISDLDYIRTDGGRIEIGAMTSHNGIVDSELLEQHLPLLPRATTTTAGPMVRNKGTIGGSVAFGHRAGTQPVVLTALDATLTLVTSNGSRNIAAEDFFLGHKETEIRDGELLQNVTISTKPFPVDRTGMAFCDLKRTTHQFPRLSTGVAVRISDSDGDVPVVERAWITFGNAGDTPLRMRDAEEAVEGTPLSDDALHAATSAATDAADPVDELQADAEYKENMVGTFTRRGLKTAYENALSKG